MIVLGLFAALFTIFVTGLGVTMSIFARTGRFNLIECVCLGWLLGVGIVSLLLWIGGVFCSGFVLQGIVTVAGFAFWFFGGGAKQKTDAQFHLPRPTDVTGWVL